MDISLHEGSTFSIHSRHAGPFVNMHAGIIVWSKNSCIHFSSPLSYNMHACRNYNIKEDAIELRYN